MYAYWILGIIVSVFTKFASICLQKKDKHFLYTIFAVLLSVLIIFIVCSFAGCRNPYSVGTDTAGYGISDFVNGCDLS